MKRDAGLMAVRLAAILWGTLQAGAALTASPETATSRPAVEKRMDNAQTKQRPQVEPQNRKRAQPLRQEAPAEAALCDGVPFAPANRQEAAGGKRR